MKGKILAAIVVLTVGGTGGLVNANDLKSCLDQIKQQYPAEIERLERVSEVVDECLSDPRKNVRFCFGFAGQKHPPTPEVAKAKKECVARYRPPDKETLCQRARVACSGIIGVCKANARQAQREQALCRNTAQNYNPGFRSDNRTIENCFRSANSAIKACRVASDCLRQNGCNERVQ